MKTKQEQKEQRKERLLIFRENYLPEIKNMFYTEAHGPANAPDTMYKIFINAILNFDYYPMSERINKNENKRGKWKNKWRNCSADDFLKGLQNMYDYKKSIENKKQ